MAQPLSWEAFDRRCAHCGIRGETVQEAWRAYTHQEQHADVDDLLSYFIVPTDVTAGDGEPQRDAVVSAASQQHGHAPTARGAHASAQLRANDDLDARVLRCNGHHTRSVPRS